MYNNSRVWDKSDLISLHPKLLPSRSRHLVMVGVKAKVMSTEAETKVLPALVSKRWVVLAQQVSWPRSSRSGPDTAWWCFHLLVSWEGEWDVSESARLLLSVYTFAFCILIIGFPGGEDKPQKGAQGGGCHAPVFYCFRAFWAVMDFQGTGRASVSVARRKMRGWLRGRGG